MLTHAEAELSEVRLHYVTAGAGKLILLLHGFPAFWRMWRAQLAALADRYRVVALDMRGYNLSSKPSGVAPYRLDRLVEDVRELADQLGYARLTLVGHDWGGIVAWEFAARYPARLDRLVTLGALPLNLWRRALRASPAQRERSAYIALLDSPDGVARLAADDYAMLVHSELGEPLDRRGFTAADRTAYRAAWSQPGALEAGINYYRAAGLPALLTEDGRRAAAGERWDLPPVAVPTLLLWCAQDPFIAGEVPAKLRAAVPDLTVRHVPDGTHWVVYEQPALVTEAIRGFIAGGG